MESTAILNETSTVPSGIPPRYLVGGEPLFTAYGCALLERDAGKSWAYTAVNLESGKSELLSRRKNRIEGNAHADMAAKIRVSSVRGKGVLEADRKPGECAGLKTLQDTLNAIFHGILPLHGYTLRDKQAELAEHILYAISRRAFSLAEAGVGIGKTHAYLIAAILAKRGRLNDSWFRGNLQGQNYAESKHMPVVISTSGITLQKAIATD